MSPRAAYLEAGDERVFCMLHPAAEGKAPGPAVLLCPPLGWEDLTSYRSRRDWAEHLAAKGHPVLRFDLPSTGDSAGQAEDPGRLAAWLRATAAAARHLRSQTEASRLVALGIGLGGMLALRATADGAPIDDLALWAVPARGRTLLRELGLFARMETERIVEGGAPEPPPLPAGALAPAGFLVSAETAADLGALDLTASALDGLGRRVLLLGRDGLPPDARLRAHLETSGADVSVGDGPGFAAMTEPPDQARAPHATFAAVDAWLEAAGEPSAGGASEPAG
ncbi:MAG: hypothetical protein JWM71_921, partial [Solirubrobacteraceae bacterium]|nr:hypothetical protein [Solirubrobacteraceae bacterium]